MCWQTIPLTISLANKSVVEVFDTTRQSLDCLHCVGMTAESTAGVNSRFGTLYIENTMI